MSLLKEILWDGGRTIKVDGWYDNPHGYLVFSGTTLIWDGTKEELSKKLLEYLEQLPVHNSLMWPKSSIETLSLIYHKCLDNKEKKVDVFAIRSYHTTDTELTLTKKITTKV